MKHSWLDSILASQHSNGAFPAIANLPNGSQVTDLNSFITALVVLRLLAHKDQPRIMAACLKACNFLLECQTQENSGRFMFYPAHATPRWIHEKLAADFDDTALCATVLYRCGLWPKLQLKEMAESLSDIYSIKHKPLGQEWFEKGVFLTWLNKRKLINPIDVCVNINMAAFMITADVNKTYYHPLLNMAQNALTWAGSNQEKLHELSPYYPHPSELYFALERLAPRAESVGYNLTISLKQENILKDWGLKTPVCCSLGGEVVWQSPILQTIRYWSLKQQIVDTLTTKQQFVHL